jgi:predicted nucleic acid-binding protein
MRVVFADMFYYLALVNSRDAGHAKAKEFSDAYREMIVTSSWVLIEVGDALRRDATRGQFRTFLDTVRADGRTTVVPLSEEVLARSIALYTGRPDKDWSLTDCTSFTVMADLDLTDALTGDRHFEQAGFVVLLK